MVFTYWNKMKMMKWWIKWNMKREVTVNKKILICSFTHQKTEMLEKWCEYGSICGHSFSPFFFFYILSVIITQWLIFSKHAPTWRLITLLIKTIRGAIAWHSITTRWRLCVIADMYNFIFFQFHWVLAE